MLRGYIDCVTMLGYVEGWAYDTEDSTHVVEVSIYSNDREVAWGLAHRFREDLMMASFGTGWCAYRLRLTVLIDKVRNTQLQLLDRSSRIELAQASNTAMIEDPAPPVPTIEALLETDPTLLSGVWQLKQCEQMFMRYIGKYGLEAFISSAYGYVLGRPMDANGFALYSRCLKQGVLSALGILQALEASDEFRSRPRALAAPSAQNFPFR
jgi:hypothetical protein